MSYWCHYVILVSSVKGMTRSGLLLPNKNWGIKKWSRGPLSANLSVLPDILFISHMGSIYFCSSIKDVRIRFYSKYCCSNISQLKNRIIGMSWMKGHPGLFFQTFPYFTVAFLNPSPSVSCLPRPWGRNIPWSVSESNMVNVGNYFPANPSVFSPSLHFFYFNVRANKNNLKS